MFKKYKKTLILTSFMILIPMIVGLILWNKLPAEIATHFDYEGNPNGWSGKMMTVFGIPGIVFVVHWLCAYFTMHDPKSENINEKIFRIVLWICPIISIMCSGMVYVYALGGENYSSVIAPLLCGITFVIVGNYLPKTRRNYTVGIKIPWTLADDDNWNKTHRLAGKLWVICGLLMIIGVFIPVKYFKYTFVPTMLVMVFIPCIYSFVLYKNSK